MSPGKERTMKKLVIASGLVAGAMALIPSPNADATPYDMGCENSGHAGLLNWIQRREICDGPRQADGSWQRQRVIFTPAHTVPASSSCGDFGCTFSSEESYGLTVQEKTVYQVSDRAGAENQPLPDEPGWLPPGTDNIR